MAKRRSHTVRKNPTAGRETGKDPPSGQPTSTGEEEIHLPLLRLFIRSATLDEGTQAGNHLDSRDGRVWIGTANPSEPGERNLGTEIERALSGACGGLDPIAIEIEPGKQILRPDSLEDDLFEEQVAQTIIEELRLSRAALHSATPKDRREARKLLTDCAKRLGIGRRTFKDVPISVFVDALARQVQRGRDIFRSHVGKEGEVAATEKAREEAEEEIRSLMNDWKLRGGDPAWDLIRCERHWRRLFSSEITPGAGVPVALYLARQLLGTGHGPSPIDW